MENFKKALKLAITDKAEAVRFEDGQSPCLLFFAGDKPLFQLPVSGNQDVRSLMDALVANGEKLGENAQEGVLSIVNFGELKLIAHYETPLRLYAFIPPQGNQMYQQVRNQILGHQKPLPKPLELEAAALPSLGQFALGASTNQEPFQAYDASAGVPAGGAPSPEIFDGAESDEPFLAPFDPNEKKTHPTVVARDASIFSTGSLQELSPSPLSSAALPDFNPDAPPDFGAPPIKVRVLPDFSMSADPDSELSIPDIALASVAARKEPDFGLGNSAPSSLLGSEPDDFAISLAPRQDFSAVPSDLGTGGFDPDSSALAFVPVPKLGNEESYHYQVSQPLEVSSRDPIAELIPPIHSAPLHEAPSAPVGPLAAAPRVAPATSAAPSVAPATSAAPTVSLATAAAPESPPSERSVIHFGASIPGESIVRDGREFPIDPLLQDMIKRKASDVHLTAGEVLCMRIDGEIVRVGKEILREDRMRELLTPIMPPRNVEEFFKISDTDFAYEIPGLARFRVNIFRDRMGVGAVLRQIPEKILSADDLGLPPAVRRFCELAKGLVVVTGPTGSGKSTTLAGMVDLINETRHEHILTIEDPIEFVHPQKNCLLNQREVHRHTGSFSRALKAALREDPDIILIGEMRDLETVEIAIETAETGHLVFGTLHTNTAISTIDRLIDQFPAEQQEQIRVMLAESLKGVVAQTLVRKKGGGRVAALEILVVDKAVSSLIREGNTHMMGNHMQTQKARGNIMLNDSLLNLVVKGVVEAKDAYMKSIEKEAFLTMLQAKGITLEVAKSA